MILGFDTATPATTVALWDLARERVLEVRDDPPVGAKARAHRAAARADRGGARPRRSRLGRRRADRRRDRTGDVHRAPDRDRHRARPGTGAGDPAGRDLDARVARVRRLDAAAAGASAETVVSVLDARRGEAFAAAWRLPELIASSRAPCPRPGCSRGAHPTVGAAPLAVGDGAIKFREVLERSGASVPEEELAAPQGHRDQPLSPRRRSPGEPPRRDSARRTCAFPMPS